MENVFHDFLHGATGNKASDYYYVLNTRGSKIYYSKITGKRIAKSDIRPEFHNLIGLKVDNVEDLLNLKKTYLSEIEALKVKISEIDKQLEGKVQDENERKENLRRLFEALDKKREVPQDLLQKLNITTKKEWKNWLLKNHPDKGGDEEMCKNVIQAGRNKGW